jgi:serine protease AprX
LNPRVIAVGSVDARGMYGSRDDDVSSFSSVGTAARRVDVVAPGRSIMSLRVPGGYSDVEYPSARVGSRLFKGSGTSQSAAVVSGAVALLLDQRPSLTPDQVKELLMSTGRNLRNASRSEQGAGLVDLIGARRAATPSPGRSRQALVPATGLGTLDGARGSNRLVSNDMVLSGEQDIFGNEWNAHSIATAMINELNWIGGIFNGFAWTGEGWDGAAWKAVTWTKNSWSGESWTKNSWSKNSWSADGWTGDGWVKNSWSGDDWTKNSWSTYDKNSWSSALWR